MRPKTYIRLLLVILVMATSLILFSYSHKKADADERSTECGGKSCEKKTHSEFILWESLTRNLLSVKD